MTTIVEVWKLIEGYNDYYVSNLGRIKSVKFGKELILVPFKFNNQYHVTLTENNISHNYRVVTLVLKAFSKVKKKRYDVRFIDGNENNLAFSNLEILSKIKYSKRLDKETVISIFIDCKDMEVIEVAKKYKITQSKVCSIKNRVVYKEYTKHLIEVI